MTESNKTFNRNAFNSFKTKMTSSNFALTTGAEHVYRAMSIAQMKQALASGRISPKSRRRRHTPKYHVDRGSTCDTEYISASVEFVAAVSNVLQFNDSESRKNVVIAMMKVSDIGDDGLFIPIIPLWNVGYASAHLDSVYARNFALSSEELLFDCYEEDILVSCVKTWFTWDDICEWLKNPFNRRALKSYNESLAGSSRHHQVMESWHALAQECASFRKEED